MSYLAGDHSPLATIDERTHRVIQPGWVFDTQLAARPRPWRFVRRGKYPRILLPKCSPLAIQLGYKRIGGCR